MSLQVRLRHTLGERLLELPDRPVDEPVVVGRASTADVQVPSITVASRHCVLFVHEGRWVIQSAGGAAGTFVNGGKVEGAAFLHVGDLVMLGPEASAPMLEIDPLGAAQGRTGQPAGAVGVTAAVASATGLDSLPPSRPAYPEHVTEPAYGYAVPHPAGGHASTPGDAAAGPVGGGDDTIAWPAEGQAPLQYYPRRRRRDSSSGAVVGLLITLVLAGGAGLFLWRNYQRQRAEQVAAQAEVRAASQRPTTPATRRADDSTQAPESIFDKMNPRPTPAPRTRPATQVAPGMAPTTGPTNVPTTDPTAPDMSDVPTIGVVEPLDQDSADATATTRPDPAADDPAWKQVLAARFLQNRGKAILAFDDYARSHPGQFADKLAEYTEQVLEKAWFERLEQLCKQRDELKASIQQTDREIGEETDEAYKKRVLVPLKEKYERRLQGVEEELTTDMKYDDPKAPNLLDDAQVDKLRARRDPALYATWKKRTLAHVRQKHGEMPWGQ